MNELPSIVITGPVATNPFLENAYRGQAVPLLKARNWGDGLPEDFPLWFVYRKAPTAEDMVILWARVDLFPEGSIFQGGIDEPEGAPEVEDEILVPER